MTVDNAKVKDDASEAEAEAEFVRRARALIPTLDSLPKASDDLRKRVESELGIGEAKPAAEPPAVKKVER